MKKKKKQEKQPANEPDYRPKYKDPNPDKTEEAFMRVWNGRHPK